MPFAFRLIRAVAIINNRTQIASATRLSNQMTDQAAALARTACLPWLNVAAHPSLCDSVIHALASAPPADPSSVSAPLLCSCCCFASDYALVCAFFMGLGANAHFIDVISGSACSCTPQSQSSLLGNNMVFCSYAGEYVAASDAMSMFLFRFKPVLSAHLLTSPFTFARIFSPASAFHSLTLLSAVAGPAA